MLDNTNSIDTATPSTDTETSTPAPATRARCFVGETSVLTTFGACRISDLAQLSDNRDGWSVAYAQAVASEEARVTQQLATIDAHAAVLREVGDGAFGVSFDSVVAEAKATHMQRLAEVTGALNSRCAEQLAATLPAAIVYDPGSDTVVQRPFVRVWAQPERVTELVDVAVDTRVVLVDNIETEQHTYVRCTPEHVFITPNGDVEASRLAGQVIRRVHPDGGVDTFVVPHVLPVSLDEPVVVYDAEVEGIASFCVSSEQGPAAVVHNSHYLRAAEPTIDAFVDAVAESASAEASRVGTRGLLAPASMPDTGTPEYSTFIHQSRYARWRDDLGRRETWGETVARYFDFFAERYPSVVDALVPVQASVLHTDVMPSMRALWSAGPSLRRCNVVGYNCAYCAVDSPRVFDEAVYVLMSGCGLGFSVERQYVKRLPTVAEDFADSDTTIVVADSRTGWAKAYRELIAMLYAGQVPKWDLSKLRPAGARLLTSGGRSSGPRPLDELFKFTVQLFRAAAGRKLSSIECHDLMCFIGRIVVAGGVRRSAEISLSNPSDDRLRHAKSGQWWIDNEQRALANNSAAYTERPDFDVFMREWLALYESKSGERGIYNRVAAQNKAARIGREVDDFGTNPCGEISLRSMQFCNLTEVVVRADDTLESLCRKVEHATILGTLQSDLLDFKYLRKRWRDNCAEERLLGVSLTGITDHPVLGNPDHPKLAAHLAVLRIVARETNERWAALLGIPASKAITTVKPSGTVSQLVNSASGVHPRFAPYYLRRVRADHHDPLAKLMIAQGFPSEVDERTPSNLVFSFPVASPTTARFADDIDALTQAKLWHVYATHWADHSVSCTIYYSDDEFLGLGQWVWEHFDEITGLSFLPRIEHSYVQAPYEAITREQYEATRASMPASVDWARLVEYERDDNTQGAKTYACTGDACEIVDLAQPTSH